VTRPPTLPPGGLHLWRIRTGSNGTPLRELWPLLSPQESERARRLRFDRHRERYIRAHAGLRSILSGYIDSKPQALVFKYVGTGKPLLASKSSGLDFNLTTSGDLALVGVSLDEPIGVDCEQVRELDNILGIARKMFTPEEASRIAAAAKDERLGRFHIAWTALEAEVKADGRGLIHRKSPATYCSCQVRHCVPECGFIAAVARKELPSVKDWVTLELTAG